MHLQIHKKWLVSISLAVMLLIASLTYLFAYLPQSQISIQQPRLITIANGSGFNQFCRQLARDGVVSHCGPLKWITTFQKRLRQIKRGTYLLTPEMTVDELLNMVAFGLEHEFSLTLVEGETFQQSLERVKLLQHVEQDLNETADISALLGLAHSNPEGLLFPETYFYRAGTKASELLRRANQKLQQVLQRQWQIRDEMTPLQTPYEALILASIIEKETGKADERPVIASVFINRLHKKMRLQTDPTVIYGLGSEFNGNLTKTHLRTKTPYNTYKIKGLPPTPIALVGEEAIAAALNPVPTEYLYFVAKGDGSHQFSETLKEHNRAVREYQLKGRTND